MNTRTLTDRPPDAYDLAAKCPHCQRAMFSFGTDAPVRCAYDTCPGYAETHDTTPEGRTEK